VHFLYLELCETGKNVLKFTKKFGPEISLVAPGSPVVWHVLSLSLDAMYDISCSLITHIAAVKKHVVML